MAKISATLLSSTAKVGNRVFIGIYLDTEGDAIVGVDVYMDISSHLKMLQVIPMQLMSGDFLGKDGQFWDETRIFFSQLTPINVAGGFNGKGLLAVLDCTAISAGYANIHIDFTLGSTTDTNVASLDGKDILTGVVNKRIMIT